MAKESKQVNWRWVWLGAAVILVLVFMSVRSLTRDRLEVRVVPVTNYQVFSPMATTVKAVYVQTGDQVEAGKLLLKLDDIEARARVAAAESGVKTAQAALEAATHNGTLAERQAAASDITHAQ